MLTYMSVPKSTIKCSHALFAASKSYNQIKRKRRNDNKEKSDVAKLAKIELLGLCRRERVRQITRQTDIFPSKFAKNVGLRTAVCKAIEKALGCDAMKLAPKLSEAPSMLFKTRATVAVLRTVRLSATINYETAGFHRLYVFFSKNFVHFLVFVLAA